MNPLHKTTGIIALGLFTTFQSIGQAFPGLPPGRISGIFSVLNNPATLADSGRRWDINLFSIHAAVQNNNASFGLSDFGKNFNSDDLLDQIAGDNAAPTDALVFTDILGPSFMFRAGKKSAIGVHTRVRALIGINNIDGALINEIADDEENYPINIQNNGNQLAGVHGWSEIGVTYSRNVLVNESFKLDAGITLKLLGGGVTGFATSSNLRGTLDNDLQSTAGSFLTNTTGDIRFGFSGTSLDNFDNSDLINTANLGIGADLGASFTWFSQPGSRKGLLRTGFSIMDIGTIRYDADPSKQGAYNVGIGAGEEFYLNAFDDVPVDEIKSVFQAYPQYFTPRSGNDASELKASLPTRILVDADYYFSNHFLVSVQGQISLTKQTVSKPYNSAYYSGFAITPRFFTGAFGVAAPISFNGLSKFNMGAAFQLGPVFIGSGSVLTALFGNSKQADAYFGVKFGMGTNRSSRKVVTE